MGRGRDLNVGVELVLKLKQKSARCLNLRLLKSGLMTDLLTGRVRVPEEMDFA